MNVPAKSLQFPDGPPTGKLAPQGSSAAHDVASVGVITLRGRCVVPGVIEAEALVTRDPISGWGGVDPRTGTVVGPQACSISALWRKNSSLSLAPATV